MKEFNCINCLECQHYNGECIFKEGKCEHCGNCSSELINAYYVGETNVVNVCEECFATEPFIVGRIEHI